MKSIEITLPGSKSIAARALILRHIFGNRTTLCALPDCDDTRQLADALLHLHQSHTFNLGAGGTSVRFFLALAASTPDFIGTISCSERMLQRPIAPLIHTLRKNGATIITNPSTDSDTLFPLEVRGALLTGDYQYLDSQQSSQFASALMMASLLWESPFQPEEGSISGSAPYIVMTEKMISQFKAIPSIYEIEADWSAAAFFYEYALTHPHIKLYIPHLPSPQTSLQGDAACAEIYDRIGVNSEFSAHTHGATISADSSTIFAIKESKQVVEIDITPTPDIAPSLSLGLSRAGISFRLTGIESLRYKESDRIESIINAAARMGIEICVCGNALEYRHAASEADRISSRPTLPFQSFSDHRIAMAIAASGAIDAEIAAGEEGAAIIHAGCVSKSFPQFYDQLRQLTR